MKKGFILIILVTIAVMVAAIIITVVFFIDVKQTSFSPRMPNSIAIPCGFATKACPDGSVVSAVGRYRPNCELLCPNEAIYKLVDYLALLGLTIGGGALMVELIRRRKKIQSKALRITARLFFILALIILGSGFILSYIDIFFATA